MASSLRSWKIIELGIALTSIVVVFMTAKKRLCHDFNNCLQHASQRHRRSLCSEVHAQSNFAKNNSPLIAVTSHVNPTTTSMKNEDYICLNSKQPLNQTRKNG